MGFPRFFSQHLLTDPAMISVSSARLGERGAAVAEVLGSGTCYAQGEYSGDLAVEQFVAEIDTAGDLAVATFRWKGGATSIWEANKVATSDSLISLRDGISVRFGGSGFLAGDRWLIEARRTYGRASLLDVDPARVWRATGCVLENIEVDLGVPTQVAALILARQNLSEGASATLQATDLPDLDNPATPSEYDESNGAVAVCLADGEAFVMPDFGSGADLSPFANTHVIKVVDSAGKVAWGYLHSAGTGETQGAELVTNGDFASDISGWALNAGAGGGAITWDAGTLKFLQGGTSVTMRATQDVIPSTANKLYKIMVSVVAQSGGSYTKIYIGKSGGPYAYYYEDDGGVRDVTRLVCPEGETGLRLADAQGAGYYSNWDNVSLKQITAPPATGCWVVSTPEGETRDWASVDAGFNPNDIAGYDLYLASALTGDWASPPYEQALDASLPDLICFLDEAYHYWRLVLADPDNPAGYIQAAGLYLGSYTQLSRRMLQGAKDTLGVSRSDQRVDGALRPSPVGPAVNSYSFSLSKLTTADRATLRAMFLRLNDGQSTPLWFLPDSDDPEGLLYGFLGSSQAFQLSNPARHAVSLEFEEFVP